MMIRGVAILLLCLAHCTIHSQELEPRAYAAVPKNLNSIVIGYGLSKGNVLTDPSLPVSGLNITTNAVSAIYLHTFGIGNKLARVQLSIPFSYISGKLQINGRDTSGSRNGFGDMRIRLGINLTGSPALDKSEFTHYTQKTIIGFSIVTSLPTGLYHKAKRLNTGSNRWAFKPEIGVSKRFKRVYAEVYAGVWFYTVNDEYLAEKILEQQPVFNVQGHASYYFKNLMWVSLNTTWVEGGTTHVDGVTQGETLDNWRIGGTWSVPLARGHSVKLQFHIGAFTASSYDYNVVSLVYQYIF